MVTLGKAKTAVIWEHTEITETSRAKVYKTHIYRLIYALTCYVCMLSAGRQKIMHTLME